MEFWMKVHENPQGRVVAVCDRSLLGRVFERGNQKLDLMTYAAFYKGVEAGKREVLEEIKNFSSLNIVGSGAVELAIGAGLMEKAQVRKIAGVPQAQVYRI